MAACNTIVTLQSSDEKVFTVDLKIAQLSRTIKTMFDDLGIEGDDIIPLPNVTGDILDKIIQWATHHKDDLPVQHEEGDDKRTDEISHWDAEFLKVETDILFEIICAANYLDIKSLLDTGCKVVANMIKGKTPEVIRELFNIEKNLTLEEEEQIKKENIWCEEK